MSATITKLLPEKLHIYWPFVARGLADIKRKAEEVRWIPEDIYAAIQYQTATCYLVSRNRKLLGHFIVHPRKIEFSDKTELFLWTVWAIPLRERAPDDDVYGAVLDSLAFIDRLQDEGKYFRTTTLSAREGLLRAEPYKSHFRTQFRSLTLNAISRP